MFLYEEISPHELRLNGGEAGVFGYIPFDTVHYWQILAISILTLLAIGCAGQAIVHKCRRQAARSGAVRNEKCASWRVQLPAALIGMFRYYLDVTGYLVDPNNTVEWLPTDEIRIMRQAIKYVDAIPASRLALLVDCYLVHRLRFQDFQNIAPQPHEIARLWMDISELYVLTESLVAYARCQNGPKSVGVVSPLDVQRAYQHLCREFKCLPDGRILKAIGLEPMPPDA